MADEKIESQTEGKEVAEVSDDEIASLMEQNKKLQEKENAGDGVKADYLILAKSGTKALSKLNEDLYVEGLKQGDIFIQKDKKILGSTVKVIPLAFITLYNEKDADSNDAKFFGVWSKEQASSLPFADGSDFNHIIPQNGHVLVPVNWVIVGGWKLGWFGGFAAYGIIGIICLILILIIKEYPEQAGAYNRGEPGPGGDRRQPVLP